MKKITAVFMIILMISTLLVSCGGGAGLSGAYRCDDESPNIDGRIYKIKFDGSKCTIYDSICSYGILDWEINEDKLLITGDADLGIFNVEIDYEYEFSKDGNSIFLDGIEFQKIK